MPRPEKHEELLRPIAHAMGRATIEWNGLYESLGLLFGALMYPNHPIPFMALAVWHAIPSDRTQRDILDAAARMFFENETLAAKFPQGLADIKWLLKKTGTVLAPPRNDMTHAPLTFLLDENTQARAVVASTFFGHPKAANLDGTDLEKEFQWAVAYGEKLTRFARNITISLQFEGDAHPWPDRPQLPPPVRMRTSS